MADTTSKIPNDPDLARLIEAWPNLAGAIKAGSNPNVVNPATGLDVRQIDQPEQVLEICLDHLHRAAHRLRGVALLDDGAVADRAVLEAGVGPDLAAVAARTEAPPYTLSDMSDAAGTLWLDVARRDWSDAMLAATRLSRVRR